MRRHFNYTGRRKINRSDVSIILYRSEPAQYFDADWDLSSYDLPDDAEVFVEAYYRSGFMRFSYGAIREPSPPTERYLTELPGEGIVFFRVRVVQVDGQERGRVLALADTVRPTFADEDEGEEGDVGTTWRQPILPVKHEDMRDQVWRLAFDVPQPVLEVNRRIPDIDDLLRRDRRFFALVYPEVVRQVLTRILLVEQKDASDEDSLESWQKHWLQFARTLYPDPLPQAESVEDVRPLLDEWIDGVVQRFCAIHHVRQELIEAIEL